MSKPVCKVNAFMLTRSITPMAEYKIQSSDDEDSRWNRCLALLYKIFTIVSVVLTLSLLAHVVFLGVSDGGESYATIILNTVYPCVQMPIDIFSIYAAYRSPRTLAQIKGVDLLFSGIIAISFCIVSRQQYDAKELDEMDQLHRDLELAACIVYGVITVCKICQVIILNLQLVNCGCYKNTDAEYAKRIYMDAANEV